jgi:hypothetical protein
MPFLLSILSQSRLNYGIFTDLPPSPSLAGAVGQS